MGSSSALSVESHRQLLPAEVGALIQQHIEACPSSIAAKLATEILESSGNLPDNNDFLLGRPAALVNGGGMGVDSAFAKSAATAGHLVMHWLGPSTRASKYAQECNGGGNLCKLSSTELDHPKVTAALDRCAKIRCGASSFAELCQEKPKYAAREENLRRLYFLVARVTSVYIVAHRPSKADDPGQPPMDLGGDVGWAAQMYIDRFSPGGEEENSLLRLFLFDNAQEGNPEHLNDKTTARRWTFWQAPNSRNSFIFGKWLEFGQPVPVLHRTAASMWKSKDSPPPPRGFYAGLGTPSLDWSNTKHEEALVRMYEAPPEEETNSKPKGAGKGKGKTKDRSGNDSAVPEMDV